MGNGMNEQHLHKGVVTDTLMPVSSSIPPADWILSPRES